MHLRQRRFGESAPKTGFLGYQNGCVLYVHRFVLLREDTARCYVFIRIARYCQKILFSMASIAFNLARISGNLARGMTQSRCHVSQVFRAHVGETSNRDNPTPRCRF
jgi:hypothetical protein